MLDPTHFPGLFLYIYICHIYIQYTIYNIQYIFVPHWTLKPYNICEYIFLSDFQLATSNWINWSFILSYTLKPSLTLSLFLFSFFFSFFLLFHIFIRALCLPKDKRVGRREGGEKVKLFFTNRFIRFRPFLLLHYPLRTWLHHKIQTFKFTGRFFFPLNDFVFSFYPF